MKKMVGYILMAAGLAVLALTYAPVQTALGVTLPASLSKSTLLPVAAIIIIAGAFIGFRGGIRRKKITEVPIYHEKDIVGYRRIHK